MQEKIKIILKTKLKKLFFKIIIVIIKKFLNFSLKDYFEILTLQFHLLDFNFSTKFEDVSPLLKNG